ncbi:sec-independent secretion tatD domain protein [Bacillus anthracis str. Turkey32]|nr:sec-independent secretion tatD domain protein [Bacillus anthracis str. Turkey32]
MLFDTHSHLNAEQFEEDLQEVIARMKEAGLLIQLLLVLMKQR